MVSQVSSTWSQDWSPEIVSIFRTFYIHFALSEAYLNVFDNIEITIRNCTYQRMELAIKAYQVSIAELTYYKN